MKLALSAFISFLFLLAACTFGTRYDLARAVPSLTLDSAFDLVVVVRDRRPEVMAGRRPPQWIGWQFRGPDQAREILTASGEPMTRDLAEAIVGALATSGVRAKLQEKLGIGVGRPRAGRERLLRITVHALRAESFVNVSLLYDLQAEVVGPAGRILGQSRIQGDELIGGDIVYPLGHGGALVPSALGRRLADLLEDSSIRSALK